MSEQYILEQINLLPEPLKQEVLDFVMFLQTRPTPKDDENKPYRVFGSQPGHYIMSDDFDAPLEDFREYM